MVPPGKEEIFYDRDPAQSTARSSKKDDSFTASAKRFCSLPADEIKAAKCYEMVYDKGPRDRLVWDILGDGEHINDLPLDLPDHVGYKKDLDLEDKPLIETFFEHIFPDVTGHAKLIDKILADPRASYHTPTTFCCATCEMPLCKANRKDRFRDFTCVEEHEQSEHDALACTSQHMKSTTFPPELRVKNLRSKSTRKRRRPHST